jgi:phosphoribosylamine--glycine ligase
VRTLVIGSGAREHAIIRALKQDPKVTKIYCAPGNAGIAKDANIFDCSVDDPEKLTQFAHDNKIDLVIVGPEVALVAGVVDQMQQNNISCFGPTKKAAMIEGSKAFAKKVMQEMKVPTAASFDCISIEQVEKALNQFKPPYVVKDDQLAAGKGVVVTENKEEALNHAKACLEKSNGKVVIEEFLNGKEVSILFISDGKTLIPLAPAQDYKRAFDKDLGPNTGGMGAYSPVTWINQELIDQVKKQIAQPVIDYLAKNSNSFVGVLYAGLIITEQGPKVIEFNARFGDPETQVILARLKTPITKIFFSAINTDLHNLPPIEWSNDAAVVVIRAANGYPEKPQTGDEIYLPSDSPDAYILHAGTKFSDNHLVSNGGRVLAVVGVGSTLKSAKESAYNLNSQINYENSYFRRDIADMER